MSALALISDLMTASQATAAAQRAGAPLTLVASEDALIAQAESLSPRLVIVDLSHPGMDASRLFDRLQPQLPSGATTVAFGPHVHKERLAAAAAAGFGLVLSRGRFQTEMVEILRREAT